MKTKRLQYLEKSIKKLGVIEERINRKSGRIGILRAVLFFAILILLPVSYFNFAFSVSLLLFIPLITAFITVSVIQLNLLRFLKTLRNWISIKNSFVSRMKLDWPNINSRKLPDNIKTDLLEADLDLTGERSLHQLIDLSVSNEGSLLLREFFVNHNLDDEQIISKQNTVKEILSLNRFREKFLLIQELISKKKLDSSNFIAWLKNINNVKFFKGYLAIVTFLSTANLIFITLAITDTVQNVWAFTLFFYFAFYNLGNKYYRGLSKDADIIKDELGKYSKILEFIENYDFGNNCNLKEITKIIRHSSESPSKLLNQTLRIVSILTFRANPFVWIFIILIFPVDFYLAYFLRNYKKKVSEKFESWLNVWYNLEAYVSLANFAYLNPDYNFPEIVKDNFNFKADEIGHPLIDPLKKIKNDFKVNNAGDAYIITGSNMSGKSTFLRTLGINMCLAYAGAPVDAKSFSLSPLKLFSCIKVSDSVIDGISYFYSEVKRLKQLLDIINSSQKRPVFYLIDEIFKGTNNIERRKGSSSFIKSLTGKNCVGLVSTHDLELVHLADDNKFIINYHFKEEVEKDKMIFDYKLREGPCPTTNALKIMEIEGLPVNG